MAVILRRTVFALGLVAMLVAGCDAGPPESPIADRASPSPSASASASTLTVTASPHPLPSPTPAAVPTTRKPAKATTPPPARPAVQASVAQQLLTQINEWRAAEGLQPLTMSTGLVNAAHKHNLRMAEGCRLEHQCPGEASLGDRIKAEGVTWRSAGENIGMAGPISNTTAAILSATRGLNASMHAEKPPNDGHRRNILGSGFTRIGIDVVRDAKGTVWLTQDFAS